MKEPCQLTLQSLLYILTQPLLNLLQHLGQHPSLCIVLNKTLTGGSIILLSALLFLIAGIPDFPNSLFMCLKVLLLCAFSCFLTPPKVTDCLSGPLFFPFLASFVTFFFHIILDSSPSPPLDVSLSACGLPASFLPSMDWSWLGLSVTYTFLDTIQPYGRFFLAPIFLPS